MMSHKNEPVNFKKKKLTCKKSPGLHQITGRVAMWRPTHPLARPPARIRLVPLTTSQRSRAPSLCSLALSASRSRCFSSSGKYFFSPSHSFSEHLRLYFILYIFASLIKPIIIFPSSSSSVRCSLTSDCFLDARTESTWEKTKIKILSILPASWMNFL